MEQTLAKIFTKLDANSGFWQIPLTPESSCLTTFIIPFGWFCFTRLPFGITSAPEHFQCQIAEILQDMEGVVCHMDDILVHARTQEEHRQHLQKVLLCLQESGLTLNAEKCHQTEVKFLGQIIDDNGIRPDPGMIAAIQNVSEPLYCRFDTTTIIEHQPIVSLTGTITPSCLILSNSALPLGKRGTDTWRSAVNAKDFAPSFVKT